MNTLRPVSRVVIALLLVVVLMTVALTVTRVSAGGPGDDGRINELTWVNSYGAIAVYCITGNKTPGNNFTDGAIVFLNANGLEVFRAPENLINPQRELATRTRKPQFIHTQGIYTLWALPDGFFQITTPPDAEGKTSLAVWKDCAGPRIPSAAPTPTEIPR